MIQVSSPGLPPWPKVWFDEELNRACVVARHATWRSYEIAYRATDYLSILFNVAFVWGAWHVFQTPDTPLRLLLVLIVWHILTPLVSTITKIVFPEPLARYIFSTQTTLWVTDRSVIFKSRLYRSPIVVWRYWKGNVVRLRFITQKDHEASNLLSDQQQQRRTPRGAINDAAVVAIVVTTPLSQKSQMAVDQSALQRAIPIMEVSGAEAQKLSTAFDAALMLIRVNGASDVPGNQSLGVDIDSA